MSRRDGAWFNEERGYTTTHRGRGRSATTELRQPRGGRRGRRRRTPWPSSVDVLHGRRWPPRAPGPRRRRRRRRVDLGPTLRERAPAPECGRVAGFVEDAAGAAPEEAQAATAAAARWRAPIYETERRRARRRPSALLEVRWRKGDARGRHLPRRLGHGVQVEPVALADAPQATGVPAG